MGPDCFAEKSTLCSSPPVPKTRQFIGGRPISESAAKNQHSPRTTSNHENEQDVPKPSLRTRSSSLTLHDKSDAASRNSDRNSDRNSSEFRNSSDRNSDLRNSSDRGNSEFPITETNSISKTATANQN